MSTVALSTEAAGTPIAPTARPSVLIVVPAYNEEQNIAGVVSALRAAVPDYDRLFVNDCAVDGTGIVLDRMGERQLRLPCNLGYGGALQTGLRYGLDRAYDVIVSFDADGQHRAEDVAVLVRRLLDERADLVIGSRYGGGRPYAGPLERRVGQRLFSWLTGLLTGRRIFDTTSGLKAMTAVGARAVNDTLSQDFHTETIVALSLAGYRISEQPITMLERAHGRSMHSLASIVTYPLQTLLVTLVALVDGVIHRNGKR